MVLIQWQFLIQINLYIFRLSELTHDFVHQTCYFYLSSRLAVCQFRSVFNWSFPQHFVKFLSFLEFWKYILEGHLGVEPTPRLSWHYHNFWTQLYLDSSKPAENSMSACHLELSCSFWHLLGVYRGYDIVVLTFLSRPDIGKLTWHLYVDLTIVRCLNICKLSWHNL